MADFDRDTYIPFVSEEHANSMKNNFGLNVTNPKTTMPSLTVHNFRKNKDGSNFNPFGLSSDEMKQNKNMLNKLSSNKKIQGESKFNIFRSANTNLYKADPHTAISNLMDSYDNKHAKFAFFDIETLGNIDESGEGLFTPTEIRFDIGSFDKKGGFNRQAARDFLVAPSATVQDNMKAMLETTANKIEKGLPVELSSDQTRTIKDLIKYSNGAEISNGVLKRHARAYDQYVSGSSLSLTTADPVEKALEGLKNLSNKGINSKQSALELRNFVENQVMDGNTYFAGHNISNFDIRGLNKFFGQHFDDFSINNDNYIDTFSLSKAIFPSSLSIGRVLNNKNYINNASEVTEGGYTLTGLSKILGMGEFEAHKASADVNRNIEIAGNLFYSDEAKRLINKKVLKKDVGDIDFNLGSYFDTGALKPGDVVFSTRGVAPSPDDNLSFKTIQDGNKVANSRHYINSQNPYKFAGQYADEDMGIYGVKLQNEITGEYTYINKKSKEDLRNFMYDRFVHTNEVPESKLNSWYDYARKDIARSKFRKLTSSVDKSGIGHVDRLLEAYDKENNMLNNLRSDIKKVDGIGEVKANKVVDYFQTGNVSSLDDLKNVSGIGDKTINKIRKSQKVTDDMLNFYGEGLNNIFSFTKEGQQQVMGNYPEYYTQMRDRIGSEYDILKRLSDKVQDTYNLSNVSEGSSEFWRLKRKQHMLFVRSYQNLQEEIGQNKEMVDIPKYKSFVFDMPTLNGRREVNIFNQGQLSANLNMEISKVRKVNNDTSAREFLASVISDAQTQIEKQYNFQQGVINARRMAKGDFETKNVNKAANELITLFEDSKKVLPDHFHVDDRISDLRNSTKNVEQHIKDAQNILGGRIGEKQYNRAYSTLDSLKNQSLKVGFNSDGSATMEGTGNIVQSFEDTLRLNRDGFFAFNKNKRTVESLSSRDLKRFDKSTINKLVDSAYNSGRQTVDDVYQATYKDIGKIFDSGFDSQLINTVDALDENLNRLYKKHNIDNAPRSMKESLEQLTRTMQKKTQFQTDGKLNFNMYMSGGIEEPKVTFAFFDSNSEAITGKTLSEVKGMNNIATMDVPLISVDQYLYQGNQKKISPLLMLDLKDGADAKEALSKGDVVAKNSFGHIVDNMKNGYFLDEMLERMMDGDIQGAQRLANKQVNSAIEKMSGSVEDAYFNESYNLYSENARADMIKKETVIFKNILESEDGNWYNLDSTKPMYASDKLNFFSSGGASKILRDTLGNNITMSMAGTRAKYMSKGMMTMSDVRNFVPFGKYNDPSRANMVQIQNMRKLTNNSVDMFEENMGKGAFNMNVTSFRDYMSRELNDEMAKNLSGVNTNVAVMSEYDMLNNIKGAIDELEAEGVDVSRDKELFNSKAFVPSVWENQALASEEFAKSYRSTRPHAKKYDGKLDLKGDLRYGKGINYQPEYDEVLGKNNAGEDVRNEYRTKQNIRDIIYDESTDQTIVQYEDMFKSREGVTKLGVGTEKFTLRNVFSKEVIRKATGGNADLIISPSHQSHIAYGDVINGLLSQTIDKINKKQELDDITKKQKLQDIASLITETFGLKTKVLKQGKRNDFTVVFDDSADAFTKVSYYSDDAAGKGLEELVPTLDKILKGAGVDEGLDRNILNLETRFLRHEENIHHLAFDGSGKKGARYTAKEVSFLKNSGFTSTSKYLRKRIGQESKENLGKEFDSMVSRGRSYDYLRRELTDGAKEVTEDEIDEILSLNELNARFKKDLPQGSFAGGSKGQYGQKGRFKMDTFKGTFLSPDRKGMWIDLPEEIDISMAAEGNERQAAHKVKKMYMSSPNPESVGNGLYVRGKVDRKQDKLMNHLKEYYMAENEHDKWIKESQKRYGEVKNKGWIKGQIEKSAQGYYDEIYSEITTAKGKVNRNLLGARLKGSGRVNVQIMSPGLELTEDVAKNMHNLDDSLDINAMDIAKNLQKTVGDKMITNPAEIHISETKAKEMLKGNKNADKILKNMQNEGHVGIVNRSPTIHPLSVMPSRIKVNKDLDKDTVRMSASMADALFADSDGDSLSFALVGETDVDDLWKDVDKTNKILTDNDTMAQGGMGSHQRNMLREFLEDIDKKQGADIIDAVSETKNKSITRFNKKVLGESEVMDQIVKAKMGKEVYTGMLTNVANSYRRIGANYLKEGELDAFRSGIGQIIETSISSKHMFSGGSKRASVQGVDPQEVINILRNAGTEKGREELAKLGPQQMDLLTNEQTRVMQKVAAEGSADFNSMTNTIFQSTKALRENHLTYFNKLNDWQDVVPSEEISMFEEMYYKEIDTAGDFESAVSTKKSKIQEELNRKRKLKKTSDEIMQASKKHFSSAFEGVAKKMPGSIGMTGALMAGGIGAVAGGMATSGGALPMDYMDEQGMQPVSNTANRSTAMNIQSQQDLESMENLDYGYKIAVSGQTTMDKDSEQLAGIVNQAVQQSIKMPVDINVNTADNREDISMKWVENKVLDLIGN